MRHTRLLCLFLVLVGSGLTPARAAGVRNAEEFSRALLDSSISDITLLDPVVLAPAGFAAVQVNRTVRITASSPTSYLDFGHAHRPLISIGAGGWLSLISLRLMHIYPLLPEPLTDNSITMPISAISMHPSSARVTISHCMLIVDGPSSTLTDALPFWFARQQSRDLQPILSPSSPVLQPTVGASSAAQTSDYVTSISHYDSTAIRDSSRIQILDSVVVSDSLGCVVPGQQLLAWDSKSLLDALQLSQDHSFRSRIASTQINSAAEVVLLANISLNPVHWSSPLSIAGNNPSVIIRSCSSLNDSRFSILDFNHLPRVLTLAPGATLHLSSNLMLMHPAGLQQQQQHAVTVEQLQQAGLSQSGSSSAVSLLLLDSIDVTNGGQLLMTDVIVSVPDAAAVERALHEVNAAVGSKPLLQPVAVPGAAAGARFAAQNSSQFVVSTWTASLASWHMESSSSAGVVAPTAAAGGCHASAMQVGR